MQWKLSGFTHCTNKETNADHSDQQPMGTRQSQASQRICFGKNFGVIERASVRDDQTNAQNKAKVTHTVNQKCLHVGKNGGWLVVPKSNQQIGNQPDCLPSKEQLKQIVAHDQHEHGKREQRNVGEEAVVALVLFHVSDGVDVNHQGNKGHHAHHHGGQTVHHEANFHFQTTNNHPFVNGFIEAGIIECHLFEGERRQYECDCHAQNG